MTVDRTPGSRPIDPAHTVPPRGIEPTQGALHARLRAAEARRVADYLDRHQPDAAAAYRDTAAAFDSAALTFDDAARTRDMATDFTRVAEDAWQAAQAAVVPPRRPAPPVTELSLPGRPDLDAVSVVAHAQADALTAGMDPAEVAARTLSGDLPTTAAAAAAACQRTVLDAADRADALAAQVAHDDELRAAQEARRESARVALATLDRDAAARATDAELDALAARIEAPPFPLLPTGAHRALAAAEEAARAYAANPDAPGALDTLADMLADTLEAGHRHAADAIRRATTEADR